MERIRKLENELRETNAVNLQSKQIWMATMNDDVDKVEQLTQEVAKRKMTCSAYMKPS